MEITWGVTNELNTQTSNKKQNITKYGSIHVIEKSFNLKEGI